MDRMTPLERELLASVSALESLHEQQMSALQTGFETQLASLMAGFEIVTNSISKRLDEVEETQRSLVTILRGLSERQDGTDQALKRVSDASSGTLGSLNGTLTGLSERLKALSETSRKR